MTALPRAHIGDVRDPQLVWTGGDEGLFDQVRRLRRGRVRDRGAPLGAADQAGDPGLPHQPLDRDRYEQAKPQAVPDGGHAVDYNRRRQHALRDIYDQMFRAAAMK